MLCVRSMLDASHNRLQGFLPVTLTQLFPMSGGSLEPLGYGGMEFEDNCLSTSVPQALQLSCGLQYCSLMPQRANC